MQKSASIQPRTDRPKFDGSVCDVCGSKLAQTCWLHRMSLMRFALFAFACEASLLSRRSKATAGVSASIDDVRSAPPKSINSRQLLAVREVICVKMKSAQVSVYTFNLIFLNQSSFRNYCEIVYTYLTLIRFSDPGVFIFARRNIPAY